MKVFAERWANAPIKTLACLAPAALATLSVLVAASVSSARQALAPAPPTTPQSAVSAQPPATGAATTQAPHVLLELNKPIEAELQGGESRSYLIHADAGQFIHAVVTQKGIHVILTLRDPAAKQVSQFYAMNGESGHDPISAIAEASGDFTLEVASRNSQALPGRFEVVLRLLETPTAGDHARVAAEVASVAALELFAAKDQASHQAAIAKWTECLQLWQSLGDLEGQALALSGIGSANYRLGEYQKAIDSFSNALPLWKTLGDSPEQAAAIENIGLSHSGLGDRQKALEYLSAAIELCRTTGDFSDEAFFLMDLGAFQGRQGEKQQALNDYTQAASVFHTLNDQPGEARALANVGAAYRDLGDKPKALDSYDRSAALSRNSHDLKTEALTLNHMAEIHGDQDELHEALDLRSRALANFRALGDRAAQLDELNRIGVLFARLHDKYHALDSYRDALQLARSLDDGKLAATILGNYASLYMQLGDSQSALGCYIKALDLARALGLQAMQAKMLDGMGVAYSNLGEMNQSTSSLEQALELYRAVKDDRGQAAALTNMAVNHANLGEEQESFDLLDQALSIYRTLDDRSELANALSIAGMVYNLLGDRPKAFELLQQALQIQQASDSNSARLASMLGAMARICIENKDFDKAIEYYNQSIALAKQAGDLRGQGESLYSIGVAYAERGDKQKALEYFQLALPLTRWVQDPMSEAATLTNIGVVDFRLGDYSRALDNLNQALPIFRATSDLEGEGQVLSALMDCWSAQQEANLAIFFGKEAIDRFQSIRRNNQGLDQQEQSSFVSSKEGIYRKLAGILVSAGRFPEAQQVLDMLKVEEFSEYTQTRGVADSPAAPVSMNPSESAANSDFEKVEADITAEGREYADLSAKSSLTPEEDKRLKTLDANLTAAKDQLQSFYKTLFTNLGSADSANSRLRTSMDTTSSLEGIVSDLGDGTVALYTLVLDDKCVILVITPDTTVAREVPITKSALRAKVFSFAGALAAHKPDAEIQTKAQDLYRLLISPIEKDLAGAKAQTLVWSLDDVLRYIPIAALYDGKQYLVERYRNVEITTASIGNLKDQPNVATWSGLAMGVSKDYEGLGALNAVPNELKSVVHTDAIPDSHGPLPGTILLNDAFTETAMEEALRKRPPLVHIASHYKFAPGNDMQSYLLLGGKDAGGEGYRLTLADITREKALDFKGVELLTLSGCQTALGSNASNGLEIDSLGMAAQHNHAKAVMASLWEVEDSSVGLLMSAFYKTWITSPGMTKAEALRQAQLSLLHGTNSAAATGQPGAASAYSNPYYWAPFILIGNWK